MGLLSVLEYIAIVAQLSGLHAIMLVALAARLLRILDCHTACAKLEESARRLRALLQWPAARTGVDVVVTTQLPAMAARALAEADGLVGSYRGSTLWCRVRTGRSMEARLRGMQDRVNCLCTFVLCVHANLLALHPSSDTNATNHHVISVPDSQSNNNGIVQGGAAEDHSDNTQPGGFESAV